MNFEDLGRNMRDGFQYNSWGFVMTGDILDHENNTEEVEHYMACCFETRD